MTVPGLDLARLAVHLENAGLTSGPLTAEVIAGGKSNLTYVVRDALSGKYVVRRPPLGHVLATAHDMAREFRVMTALRDTAVPVPETYLLCQDEDVIGAPFYVMQHVDGGQPDLSPELSHELTGILAALHAIDPAEVGLADFGRPQGFVARQVGRWKRQLDASRSREIPGMDELYERLAQAVPEEAAPAIVHGDFKLGNTLVADGHIRAVLDWEMSTLGDPLTDLALFVLYGEFAELDTGAEAVLVPVDYYAKASGRDISGLGWYVALACFKLAVIAEGIYFRFTQGLTVGEGFDEVGDQVAPLVERGLREF